METGQVQTRRVSTQPSSAPRDRQRRDTGGPCPHASGFAWRCDLNQAPATPGSKGHFRKWRWGPNAAVPQQPISGKGMSRLGCVGVFASSDVGVRTSSLHTLFPDRRRGQAPACSGAHHCHDFWLSEALGTIGAYGSIYASGGAWSKVRGNRRDVRLRWLTRSMVSSTLAQVRD